MRLPLTNVRQYRVDYSNRPSNTMSFMSAIASTSGRLDCEFVSISFLQDIIGKLTAFWQLQEFVYY